MGWQIEYQPPAKKDIQKLNPLISKRIDKKIQFFMTQSDPLEYAIKLTPGKKEGNYRWRVGDYRVVFDAQGKQITVLYIEHRRDIYR